ncbi:MAG: hypothetical protein JSV86_00990 [Gemmatimonadota bacterium]|nr:MAG: hypothetical protein JSV86_00990 [Gemmatimonadota bacterium]
MFAPRIASLVAALAVTAPTTLLGQSNAASELSVGDKVRVRAQHGEGRWWVGTVSDLGSDTLRIQRENSPNTLAFPYAMIGELEVSRGRGKSNFLPGLAYGALGGAVIVGSMMFLSGGDPDAYIGRTAEEKALIGAAVGGVLGAVLGGFFGALSHADRWEEVPLDQLRVGIMPQPRGFSVGVSVKL